MAQLSSVALTKALENTLDNMVRGVDVVLNDSLIKMKSQWLRETFTIVDLAGSLKKVKSYSEAKDLMLSNPVLSQRKIHFVRDRSIS